MSASPEYAAGWYESGPAQERYWDGQVWTDDFRPAQQTGNAISVQFTLPGPVSEAISTWQLERTGWFATGGFNLVAQSEAVLTYSRRYTPGWAVVVGLLTFPLGMLLWFFVRNTDTVTARFDLRGDDTLVTLAGTVSEKQRRALILGLPDEYNAQANPGTSGG
jgi:hypothetical protein